MQSTTHLVRAQPIGFPAIGVVDTRDPFNVISAVLLVVRFLTAGSLWRGWWVLAITVASGRPANSSSVSNQREGYARAWSFIISPCARASIFGTTAHARVGTARVVAAAGRECDAEHRDQEEGAHRLT